MKPNCRSCGNDDLEEVISLGRQSLSDFRKDSSKPPAYPLDLLFCMNCSLAQLSETVPRGLMYHDGYGYRSGVNEKLKENLGHIVQLGLEYHQNPAAWLDIASNDGTLLSLVPTSTIRIGVDPVSKFASVAQEHANKIFVDYFPLTQGSFGQLFDVISASYMFYDVDSPGAFLESVKDVLSPKGVFIVQQNYLLAMLGKTTFDNISHEHITYFSVRAMNYLALRHSLEIVDVQFNEVNGGSFVCVLARKGELTVSPRVALALQEEDEGNLLCLEGFRDFAKRTQQIIDELSLLVRSLKQRGASIGIYGASTRGATIWQACQITSEIVSHAVERQAEKVGKFFSAIGVPIISEAEMRANPPDYLLVGPWFLREYFVNREKDYLRQGGKMIFPLPVVEIVEKIS